MNGNWLQQGADVIGGVTEVFTGQNLVTGKTVNPVHVMRNICKAQGDIGSFCKRYGGEKSPVINGVKFRNFVPMKKLKRVKDCNYHEVNAGYTCGLNAINMSLKIWGYDKQLKQKDYAYKSVVNSKDRWGMTGKEMYEYNIKPVFKYRSGSWDSWPGSERDLNIDFVNGTDYTKYTLMFVSGLGFKGHYMMVIGVSVDKKYYLITDQQCVIWLVRAKDMKKENLFYYKFNGGFSVTNVRSFYRMG